MVRNSSKSPRKSLASNAPKIACVIPAFNEEATINEIVRNAKTFTDLVIVVDDGSTDQTVRNASTSGAIVVSHPFNLGAGAAVTTGLELAVRADADYIVTVDGDGQHDTADIPLVIKPVLDGKADLVIGSRRWEDARGMPVYKRIGNTLLTFLASRKSRLRITDSESGFRGMTRAVAENVRCDAVGYSFSSEMIVRTNQQGYRVSEIPIHVVYPRGRTRGTSFMDGLRIALRTITIPR